ncbi:MAG: hypothetical protein HYS13_01920 [Planctomycetia bacterium]|nr:hypothetical protein [Planctomycetia bacterium]
MLLTSVAAVLLAFAALVFMYLLYLGLYYLGCLAAGEGVPNFFKSMGLVALTLVTAGLINLIIALFGILFVVAAIGGVTNIPNNLWLFRALEVVLMIVGFGICVMTGGAIYNWGLKTEEGQKIATVQFGIPALIAFAFLMLSIIAVRDPAGGKQPGEVAFGSSLFNRPDPVPDTSYTPGGSTVVIPTAGGGSVSPGPGSYYTPPAGGIGSGPRGTGQFPPNGIGSPPGDASPGGLSLPPVPLDGSDPPGRDTPFPPSDPPMGPDGGSRLPPAGRPPDAALPPGATGPSTGASTGAQQTTDPPPRPAPVTLADKSLRSLEEGRIDDALQFLYAEALVDEAALRRVRWSARLGRPKIAVRWGIGTVGPVFAGATIDWGVTQTAAVAGAGAGDRQPPGADGGNPPMPGEAGGLPPGGGAQGADPLGGVAARVGRHLQDKTYRAGLGKSGLPVVAVLDTAENVNALLARASDQGLDAVAVVVVSTKYIGLNRNRDDSLSVEIYDVARKKAAGKTKVVSARQAAIERQKGRDILAQIVREATGIIDKEFDLVRAPTLTAAEAKSRAAALIDERADPIKGMFELKFYQSTSLLSGDDVFRAMVSLIGEDDAAKFLDGSRDEQLKLLDPLLPKIN